MGNKLLRNVIRKFLALNTIARIIHNFFLNRAVCKITRKTIVELDRPQMTIRLMRIARWITKAKTHTLRIYNNSRFSTAKMVACFFLFSPHKIVSFIFTLFFPYFLLYIFHLFRFSFFPYILPYFLICFLLLAFYTATNNHRPFPANLCLEKL